MEFDDRILTGFNISALGRTSIFWMHTDIYVDLNANRNDAYLSIYNVNTTERNQRQLVLSWSTAQSGILTCLIAHRAAAR